jgi:hypothetical protein
VAADIFDLDRAADERIGDEPLHLVWNVGCRCREYRICGDDARRFDRVYPIHEEPPQVINKETQILRLFVVWGHTIKALMPLNNGIIDLMAL